MLTLGSVVLAVINIGVMWAMAHRWRYAWHSNLALQLLWVPYDIITEQYGMLALGAIVACVSLKACLQPAVIREAEAARSQHQPRRRGTRAIGAGRQPVALAHEGADVRRSGLLSSARGRHAARRLSVTGPAPAPYREAQPVRLPTAAEPSMLVRR